ncbi:MAG: fused MFS/spermidine synthase [Candidatus Firestonebacteria bacterium]|nr:fused MFS/spermidine synthase [Candidatus Firestonebacteria bacterium]
MKRSIYFSFFLIGFTSLLGQILLLRNFMLVFYGNEISLGIVLLCWMFWTAVGSWGLGTLTENSKNTPGYLVICQLAIAVLLPCEIFLVRILKYLLHLPATEIIKLSSMFSSAFFILFPLCIILGFMFSLCSRLHAKEEISNNKNESNGTISIGNVYLWESLGAITGGGFYNFIFVNRLDSFSISYITGAVSISISIILLFYFKKQNVISSLYIKILNGAVLITCIVLFWMIQLNLSGLSNKLLWKDYKLIESKNSIYGNITIVKNESENQIIFFENGLYLFTVPDILPAEETAHFSLLSHPIPKRILLIGNGFGGILKEILKHRVEKVVYAEIDPLIIEMAEKYLPEDIFTDKENRVEIQNMDGRYYIKTTSARFDVVIVNLGDPLTAGLNRFYTEEFFMEVKNILNPGGVLSIKVSSSENYISKEQQQYLASLKNTLTKIFPEIRIVIGQGANFFLGLKGKGNFYIDVRLLMDRLKKRQINAKFFQEYYLKVFMTKNRIAYFVDTIDKVQNTKINQDYNPTCYYYNLVFWNALFNPEYLPILQKVLTFDFWWLLAIIFIIFIFLYFIRGDSIKRQDISVLAVVMANGFTEMLFEIVILLVFQSLYGYLFYKVGFIIMSFMIGLSIGTFFAMNHLDKELNPISKLIEIEFFTLAYSLFLIITFYLVKEITLPYLVTEILFPILTAGIGFLGGYQFPYAVKAYFKTDKEVGKTAGILYGIDLAGGCLGAIATNIILIPVFGIYKTCVVSIFVSLCALSFMKISSKKF